MIFVSGSIFGGEELSTAGDGSALLCLICYLRGKEKGTFWSSIDPRTSGRFITALTFRRAVTATLAPNNGSTVINHTGVRVFGPPRTLKHYLTQVLFICVCVTAAPVLVEVNFIFPVPVDVCSAGEAATAKGGIMSLQDSGFVRKMWRPFEFRRKKKTKTQC